MLLDRYDKTKPPKADADCGLGCKRRHNKKSAGEGAASSEVASAPPVTPTTTPSPPSTTPTTYPVPADKARVGEFYWGYGSGVVVTKVSGWGEFVLSELTQSFDHGDLSYFFPLMRQAEKNLGFRPRFGTFDGGFDAWYVYAYFHRQDVPWPQASAAVPFSEKGGYKDRLFSPDGLPLCRAGLPMPVKGTFLDRTSLVEHECARYACPLFFPVRTEQPCPLGDDHWAKGGCVATFPTSIGARLRYQIDRESETYKLIYKERTATERINSQATELGIETPKLRCGQAIANQNTLIYLLIDLRALQRVRAKKAALTQRQEANPPVNG